MEYKRSRNLLVIRLDEGEEIVKNLSKICVKEKIEAGVILSLVGAIKRCELIFREGYNEVFNEHLEILGNGNTSTLDGQPKIHLHVTCGNDAKARTGHLVEGTVTVFCEIVLQTLKGFEMKRNLDKELVKENVQFPYKLTP